MRICEGMLNTIGFPYLHMIYAPRSPPPRYRGGVALNAVWEVSDDSRFPPCWLDRDGFASYENIKYTNQLEIETNM